MARERGSRAGESRWQGPKPREDSEWEGESGDSDSANEDGAGAVQSTQASATGQSAPQPEEARRMYKFRTNPRRLRSVVSKAPNPTEGNKEIIVRTPHNLNAATTNAAAATTTNLGTASSTASNNLPVASTHTASQPSTAHTASQSSTAYTVSQSSTAYTAGQLSAAHTASFNVPVAAAPTINPGTASSTTSNNLLVASNPTAIMPGITSSTTGGNVPIASTRPIAKPKASSSSTTSNNVPVARTPTVHKRKASSSSTTGKNVPAARTATVAKPKASASSSAVSNSPAARAPTTTKPGASSSTIANRVPIIRGPTLDFPRANPTVAGARSDGIRTSNALVAGPQTPTPASSVPATPVPAVRVSAVPVASVPAASVPAAPVPAAGPGFFTPSGPQPSPDASIPTVNQTSEDQSRAGLAKNQYRDDAGAIVTCPVGTCFSQDPREWPRNTYHTAEEYIQTSVASDRADDVEDRQYLLGVQSGIGMGIAMLRRLLLREYEVTGRLWNLPVAFESPEGVPATRAAVAELIASADIVEMMAAMDAGNQSIMLHAGSGDDEDDDDESDGDGADESDDESDDDDDDDDDAAPALATARPVQGPSLPEYVSPADVFWGGQYGPEE